MFYIVLQQIACVNKKSLMKYSRKAQEYPAIYSDNVGGMVMNVTEAGGTVQNREQRTRYKMRTLTLLASVLLRT
jgi:hypothetical protein